MPDANAEKDKANSLAIPLSQALRSQDKELLNKCISTSNPKTILVTVANLSPADAGSLLETSVQRLEQKIGQRQTLVAWIKAVLLKHTAFLISSGGQQQNLAKLQQVIEDQTQLIQPLTMLSGRLELLLAQTESADGDTDDTVGAEKDSVSGSDEEMESEESEEE